MSLLDDLDTYTTPASIESGVVATVAAPIRWHRDARCNGDDVDPELFFPERGGSTPGRAPSVPSARSRGTASATRSTTPR